MGDFGFPDLGTSYWQVSEIYVRTNSSTISLQVSSSPNSAVTRVAETVAKLKKIKTESFDTNVPEAAKPLLMTLKHQLRDLVEIAINKGESSDPEKLEQQIIDELNQSGVTIQQPVQIVVDENYVDKGYTYGDIDGISVKKAAGYPDLLVMTTTLSVCCGEDTSLYLFQNRNGRWSLTLADESNYYDEVNGAQGDFEYRISEGGTPDDFFVVVADITPWCSSNWQTLRYKVLRVGQSADSRQNTSQRQSHHIRG